MTSPAPRWFMVVSVLALLWNLLGVTAFIMQMTMTPEMVSQLPEAEQALYRALPLWVVIAFACAVFGGALGSLGLVLKRRLAVPLLWISLIGVIVQLSHSLFMSNTMEVYGPGALVMPIMVLIIAIGLLLLGHKARTAGWLKS
jgi:hypothetical protein